MNTTAAIIGALTLFLPSLAAFIVTMTKLFREIRANKADTDDKLEALHRSTNGLSERNEAIARKLGVAEGTADEKAAQKDRDGS